MLKADWRSFSEANLVQRLLTLFHLEEFEPTLPKGAHLAGMDIIWEIFGNLDQVLIPLKMEITIPIHQVRYFSSLICFYLN